jgi:hypothetical protein
MSAKENGVHFIEREEYDRLARVNWSTLKHIGRSPAHYHAALTAPQKDTDPMKLGRAGHLAVFEPEQFRAKCVVFEGKVRRGTDWDAFLERHPDDEILTPTMHASAIALGHAVRNDPVARKYVTGGKGELTVVWDYEAPATDKPGFKVQCKSRIDFVAETGAIVDVKSTANASPAAFGRQCWNMEYHAQAAFYRRAYQQATGQLLPYFIVAAEKTAPFAVVVYRIPDEILELGEQRIDELLALYNTCRERSRWPGYAEDVLELTLPKWAVPFEDDDVSSLGLTFGGSPAIGFGQ